MLRVPTIDSNSGVHLITRDDEVFLMYRDISSDIFHVGGYLRSITNAFEIDRYRISFTARYTEIEEIHDLLNHFLADVCDRARRIFRTIIA